MDPELPDDEPAAPSGTAEASLTALAPLYRAALALDDAAVPPDEIAVALNVPVEAIPAMVRLARAKAAALADGGAASSAD